MGLASTLNNALSGMLVSQNSLTVVSRNVSNAGTPGYHQQSLNVVDVMGLNSSSARSGQIVRAFDQALQASYNTAVSDSGYTTTMTNMLDRLQTYFGKPGDDGSLDSVYGDFLNAMQALSTSPDDYSTRSTVVSKAQDLVATLNGLSQNVQTLRRDAETQMQSSVVTLNQAITSLQNVNGKLSVQGGDDGSRAALLDQRDRLVSTISEQVDVQADYRPDGSVALMTKTGVGILDGKASTFEFEPAGGLTAEKQFNADPDKNGVGRLYIVTPGGLKIDVVQQNVLQSGTLKALTDLRDKQLTAAQSQLDTIAAGLSQAMSINTTLGTPTSTGTANGFTLDPANVVDGNDVTLSYTINGVPKTIRLVRVDDGSKLPLDYMDANGNRVVGALFTQPPPADVHGAADATVIANALQQALGATSPIQVSVVPGSAGPPAVPDTVQVLNDGTGTSSVQTFTKHATATSLQNGSDLGVNLFLDNNTKTFTDSLSGAPQKLGYAARISVNPAILADNRYVAQFDPMGSVGEDDRVNYLLDQLQNMTFATPQSSLSDLGSFRLGGSVSDMISQTMDYTGNVAANAKSNSDGQQATMDSLSQRMDSTYGVNVDDEMGRLLELQNAYSANARVISVVQDLMNKLLEI